jgi:hypothetical protein
MTQRRAPITDRVYQLETEEEVEHANFLWYFTTESERILGHPTRGSVILDAEALDSFNRVMGYRKVANEFYILEPLRLPA